MLQWHRSDILDVFQHYYAWYNMRETIKLIRWRWVLQIRVIRGLLSIKTPLSSTDTITAAIVKLYIVMKVFQQKRTTLTIKGQKSCQSPSWHFYISLFCPINSPKHKNIQFAITGDWDNKQRFPLEKLKPEDFWHCWKNVYFPPIKSLIKTSSCSYLKVFEQEKHAKTTTKQDKFTISLTSGTRKLNNWL